NMLISQVTGGDGALTQGAPAASGAACDDTDRTCNFVSRVLGSTEDVWSAQFQQGRLPNYGRSPGAYADPKLVLFSGSVDTGCGTAGSDVGPFYCPADHQLYLDPTFYAVMAQRLQAPGDFAQAYVIAHEIGHHVQNLIGATEAGPQESRNHHSVRVELQADCFAGVWGKQAQAAINVDQADIQEALNAAHQIGDDTLQRNAQGYTTPDAYTHGTSEQRMRWFQRGFQSGDARQCDTMQGAYNAL
ncbi:MAG: neutral zinc metallopeptidase, partial [Hyphomonadaceae bacterium]